MTLLKNTDETISNLAGQALTKDFAIKTFNRHVEAIYWDMGRLEHRKAREALLIAPNDSQVAMCNKQMLLFFSLQKFTQQIEDHISFAKGTAPNEEGMARAKVILRPSKLYKDDGSPIGMRYINVPHIDESQLELRDFTFIHGAITRLYTFADKKQIKVLALNEDEGNKAINRLLKLVKKEWLLGSAEEHGYTGKPPNDAEPPELLGIQSRAVSMDITGSSIGVTYRMFL